MLRSSISSACFRAALKSASSHFNSGRLCEARSWLSSSNSSRSDSLRGGVSDCAFAEPATENTNIADARSEANFFIQVKKRSAAHANRAEAHHYVPASGWPAEAQHGAEARKEKHLVHLPAQLRARGTGKNLVIGHAAFCIHGHIDQKPMRRGKFAVMFFGRPGFRI